MTRSRRFLSRTLRARHNAAGVRRNIDARHSLVVAFELILQLERTSNPAIKLDRRVLGHCESRAIGGEGVVRDGVVEKMVNLGGGHLGAVVSKLR